MKENGICRENDIPWQEKEKIRHEVNTLYHKYRRMEVIIHRSVGCDNEYYVYYIENLGFDDYVFIARLRNRD